MAASTKNIRSSAKEDIKQQDIIQAVVIADNFTENFSPLTDSTPTVLLPVVNTTLLNYVLQSLEECGIQETFIFCCAHNQQIRSYISSSKWSLTESSMSVTVISSSTFMSLGDMMRELDSKALIRTDFILLRGDVIFNFNLTDILDKHKEQRQSNKGCAITLLYREASPNKMSRCKEDNFLVAVESNTQRIRYYQRINKLQSLNIPLEVFQENEEVSIHYNLQDTHIAMCSPCVPPLFSDNFDYQTLDDFIKGLIVNEELLGNSMFIHIAKYGYGASVSNFVMYDAVSQDILSRWTYPIVPDTFGILDSKYNYFKHNIYKASDVEVGRNCILKQNILIGKGTTIGENCVISNSVIGENCIIGKNTEINGSYLWSDVKIGNNGILHKCLIAEKVTVHSNVTINKGCILGSEVIIGDNVILPPFTKLRHKAAPDEDDDFGEEQSKDKEMSCDKKLVGENGLGFLCHSASESDDENENLIEDIWGKPEEESIYDDETADTSSSLDAGDIMSEESDGIGGDYDDDMASFYMEVLESLQRGVEERIKSENLILEINSSKHAYNVSMKEVNTLLVKAILKIPLAGNIELNAQQYLASMKKNLLFFQPLVSNYIKSAESQLDCLSSVEDFMKSNEELCPAIIKVIHFWYDRDILNESVILKWFTNITPENDNIKKQASSFIKWLQEADEESSED